MNNRSNARVGERQRQRVALHERCLRTRSPAISSIRWLLIQRGDLTAQVPGEKAGPAGDVERARGRQPVHRALERGDLLVPARPVALREAAETQVPLVVFRGAGVVVLLHPDPMVARMLVD